MDIPAYDTIVIHCGRCIDNRVFPYKCIGLNNYTSHDLSPFTKFCLFRDQSMKMRKRWNKKTDLLSFFIQPLPDAVILDAAYTNACHFYIRLKQFNKKFIFSQYNNT